MKKIYLPALAAAATLCIFASCRKELPYPIDEVKRGVLIDVTRAPGAAGVILAGQTAGDCKVKLDIPAYQGDYSSLRHAQLLAVLIDTLSAASARVMVDNITAFPAEVSVSVADVYSAFGRSSPVQGEALYFTANVALKSGDLIPGWSEYTGFNNQAFAGWKTDGRAYSYSVRYPVTCPLNIGAFTGTKNISDGWWGSSYQVTVAATSGAELTVSGLFENYVDHDLVITVDTLAHTVAIAKQVLVDNTSIWGMDPYTNFSLEGSGTIDACNGKITFTATPRVDQGTFETVTVTIY
jgi:hypothetical protein